MANRTNDDKEEIRKIIFDAIERSGVPTALGMQEYLEGFGFRVSIGTITAIYKELGYTPKRQPSFVWKHKESHE